MQRRIAGMTVPCVAGIRGRFAPPATAMLLAATLLLSGCRDGDTVPATMTGTTAEEATPARVSNVATLQASPQARAWRDRKAFERDMRAFLREAPTLGAAQRSERARTLDAGIDAYERDRQLSAGEAVVLRAGLIQAMGGTDREQAERVAALAGRYRADAERREADWITHQAHDPKLQSYKARERAVVAEVAAMDTFPDGLSRDAYLRQRLQGERERIYHR